MDNQYNTPNFDGLTFEKVWTMFQETDKKFQKTEMMIQETGKEIKELKTMIFGIGENQGDDAEDFFYNAFSNTMNVNGVTYDYVNRNLRRRRNRVENEYDIMLVNGNALIVIEVKYKFHPRDVVRFAETKLTNFKVLFPEFATYTLQAGVAAYTFPNDSITSATALGIMVFTRSGEQVKLLTPDHFTPKAF